MVFFLLWWMKQSLYLTFTFGMNSSLCVIIRIKFIEVLPFRKGKQWQYIYSLKIYLIYVVHGEDSRIRNISATCMSVTIYKIKKERKSVFFMESALETGCTMWNSALDYDPVEHIKTELKWNLNCQMCSGNSSARLL